MDERMNIKHIRMSSFGPSTRLDSLLPEGSNLRQAYAAIDSGLSMSQSEADEAVRRLVAIVNADIAAAGSKPSECKAPPMLPTCDEPPEHLANAFRAAMN